MQLFLQVMAVGFQALLRICQAYGRSAPATLADDERGSPRFSRPSRTFWLGDNIYGINAPDTTAQARRMGELSTWSLMRGRHRL